MDAIYWVMERLGTEANEIDARQVIDLAEDLALEQGDEEFDAIDWLSSRTYDFTLLWEAANGDVSAMAQVREEAKLPLLG